MLLDIPSGCLKIIGNGPASIAYISFERKEVLLSYFSVNIGKYREMGMTLFTNTTL